MIRTLSNKPKTPFLPCASVTRSSPPGPPDLTRLKAVHRTLFGDLYDWAGRTRENTGRMTKDWPAGYSISYGDSAYVESQLAFVFDALKREKYLTGLSPDAFAKRLAHYYGEIDAIHPFREGNSRTLRQFTADLARMAGHTLEWSRALTNDADRQTLFYARDVAVMRADSSQLAGVVLTCLTHEQEHNTPATTQEERMPDTDEITEEESEVRPPRDDHAANREKSLESEGENPLGRMSDQDLEGHRKKLEQKLAKSDATWGEQFDMAHQLGELSEEEDFRLTNGANQPPEASAGTSLSEESEDIAVRLTEEQTKLLLSNTYPDNSRAQTTALYNVYTGHDDVDVMNESVKLDYSEDQKSFFATLHRDEKAALDQKLTELQNETEQKKQSKEKGRSREGDEREKERGGIER